MKNWSPTIFAVALAFFNLCGARAEAENRVAYSIALAGIGIGDMEIAVSREGLQYDARLEGSYRVLFWSGELFSRAVGKVAPQGPSPSSYRSTSRSDDPSETVINFDLGQGPVDWNRTPPAPAEWREGRLPLNKEHLRDALDPVTALAASALGSFGGTAPDVCEKAVRIFTGFVVFELDFQGVGVKQGNRIACSVIYRPLSGHRADSSSVARLAEPGSIEILFEQLNGGVWLPARVSLPTRVGSLVVERS
ncbi:MAG: hypothetical protein AAGH68_04755 [Pseudomonadota bacterium]